METWRGAESQGHSSRLDGMYKVKVALNIRIVAAVNSSEFVCMPGVV